MDATFILSLIGLMLITIGSIAAALGSPSPLYNADGSVSLSGEPDKAKRIAIYRRQKHFPKFLAIVGIGALLQATGVIWDHTVQEREMRVTEENINDAFNAIHDEAQRVLNLPPDQRQLEIDGALHLIVSLSRYRFDIRSADEIKKIEREG